MYESLDYDIVETNLHVISQRSHDSRKHLAARVRVTRWVLTALAGVFTALVACGIDLGVKWLNGLKFNLAFDLIQKGKLHAVGDALHYFWVPLLAFVGINCAPPRRRPPTTCRPGRHKADYRPESRLRMSQSATTRTSAPDARRSVRRRVRAGVRAARGVC